MEQADILQRITWPLLQWYAENARVLPWRSEPTPYRVWVSEIMLQQTRVAAVVGYFHRFMSAFPTVQALADAPEDMLLKLWQGLGYYNRARNLQRAARQIVSDYDGVFPADYDQIRALAGIGDYTAGAIASIAFGVAVPAVDGNVLRVIARILGDERDISRPDTKSAVRTLLQEVIPRECPGQFNQALMELGATVCLPNGAPLCEQCPVRAECVACQEGRTDCLPVKAPKKGRRVEERTVFLLFRNGRVALRKRPETGLLAGLWEYPNELSGQRDWPAAWGIGVTGQQSACKGKHIFTHLEWHMEAICAQAVTEALPDGWVWVTLRELEQRYAVPSAFQFVEQTVRERLHKWEVAL